MNDILDEEKKKKSDRMLEIFFRALKGERISLKKLSDEYHVSTKSIRRDINTIQEFLAEHRELLNHSEFEYSYNDKAFVMKNNEFLLNKELFAIVKVILGSRSFNKDDVLNIISKLKRFTTITEKNKFESIVRKELYHYHEVKSDCNSVIDNLWKIIQSIDEKQALTITYYKMNRDEVKHKIKPVSIMFSEYYFYLIAYNFDDENYNPIYFRIDRISNMIKHKEHFQLDRKYDFDEGNLREKNQFMFPGENLKIKFAFSGPSLQAILDRLPTAKVVERNGNTNIIETEVNYGRGIIMYLLSQGAWVKAISPSFFVDDMKAEINKMLNLYTEKNVE